MKVSSDKKGNILRDVPFKLIHLFILLICISSVFFFIFMWRAFYVDVNPPKFTRPILSVLPLPILRVDKELVSYTDFLNMRDYFKATNEDEVDSLALQYLIKITVLSQKAEELLVDVNSSSQDYNEDYLGQSGWSQKEYQKYITEPYSVYKSLEEFVLSSREFQSSSLDKIEDLKKKAEAGFSFSDLSMQFREDDGEILNEDILPYLENLEDYEVSNIIELYDYFVLAYIKDRSLIYEGDEDEEIIDLDIISIKKIPLREFVDGFISEKKVEIFLR